MYYENAIIPGIYKRTAYYFVYDYVSDDYKDERQRRVYDKKEAKRLYKHLKSCKSVKNLTAWKQKEVSKYSELKRVKF